jgi:hypothetical protein
LPNEAQVRPPLIRDAVRAGVLTPWEAPDWTALSSFLDKRWFYRVRVTQGATMAPQVLFNSGSHTVALVTVLEIWQVLLETVMFNNPFIIKKPRGGTMLRTIKQFKNGSKKVCGLPHWVY